MPGMTKYYTFCAEIDLPDGMKLAEGTTPLIHVQVYGYLDVHTRGDGSKFVTRTGPDHDLEPWSVAVNAAIDKAMENETND